MHSWQTCDKDCHHKSSTEEILSHHSVSMLTDPCREKVCIFVTLSSDISQYKKGKWLISQHAIFNWEQSVEKHPITYYIWLPWLEKVNMVSILISKLFIQNLERQENDVKLLRSKMSHISWVICLLFMNWLKWLYIIRTEKIY